MPLPAPAVPERKKITKTAAVIAAAVILLAAGSACLWYYTTKISADRSYRAVFLTNGQVYFGKTADCGKQFLRMTDIYYLQMKQPLQSQNQEALSQSDLTLIKLGNELHGPTDEMEINCDHIIFMENLKPDSKVVQAIEKYSRSK